MAATQWTPEDILGPEGRIAARLANYELRQEQLDMANAVAAAIQNEEHLVVEAGTGVGKSFSYLVPAILAAAAPKENDAEKSKTIVVSTHTISLQEQLILKDLPFLNSVIPLEFTAVLAKGRGNYLSRRRTKIASARATSIFNKEEHLQQLREIRDWTQETNDGSLADLSRQPDRTVWDEVRSDHNNCMGRNCSSYKDCFYYKARRRIQNAQIIVVNHALFFTDLALRQSGFNLLPEYDIAILDEAHTLEQVAAQHMGLSIASSQVNYTLNKLYNDRTQKGLLVHHRWLDSQRLVDECRVYSEELFGDVDQWLTERDKMVARVRSKDLVENRLTISMNKLSKSIRENADKLRDTDDHHDCMSVAERVKMIASETQEWLKQQDDSLVYWAEQSGRKYRQIKLSSSPVDIGPILRAQLFDKVPSVIMTSATLAVGNAGFDFFKSRIGAPGAKTLLLGSPFDYQRQAKIDVIQDMPDPAHEAQQYNLKCVEAIKRYVEQYDGRTFVLFTSYHAMRQVGNAITTWLAKYHYELYSQADGTPRTKMIEQFKKNPRGVLLGTDSFWQGVDVPGDALQCVIITKLPFSVPDHPLTEAKLEQIRENGGNPFMDFQLPEAIIKFKQGFGRLIRTQKDAGTVVVLDPRIVKKPYGKSFLQALPDVPVKHQSIGSS